MKHLPSAPRPASTWRLVICLCWLCAGTVRAAGPGDAFVLLDEATLTHLEQTLDHCEILTKTDPELKKDLPFLNPGSKEPPYDKKQLSGDTVQAISDAIAKRHPRFAAFAVEEEWTPKTLWATCCTCMLFPIAEADGASMGEPDDEKLRQDLHFYHLHRARMNALFMRLVKLFE